MTERPPARRGFSPRALAVLGVTAVLAVILDQVVKELSTKNLVEGEPVRILGGLVHLSLLRNSGAAFSLGRDYTWVLPVVTLVGRGPGGWGWGGASAGGVGTSATGCSGHRARSRVTWST